MTTTDHSAQLLLLDNTQISASGGKGGGLAFGGPQAYSSGTQFYMAASRIRGPTNSGSIGGSLLLETCTSSGFMTTALTINSSQQSTFTQSVTVSAGGITVTAGGLTVSAGGLTTDNNQTVNFGSSGTNNPLNVRGLITGFNGLTVSSGQTSLQNTSIAGTLTVSTGQTTNLGTSGTTSPLNVYGLITGTNGLTLNEGPLIIAGSSRRSRIGVQGMVFQLTETVETSSGNINPLAITGPSRITRTTAAAPSDTLNTTSNLISAVAATLPGSVWNDYEYFDVCFKNECAGGWTINRGDTSQVFIALEKNGASNIVERKGFANYGIITGITVWMRFMKTSSTTVNIYVF